LRPGARWPPPARLFSHSSNLLLRHSPCSAAGAAHAPRVMRGEQLSKSQIGPIRLSRQRRPLTAGRTSGCRAKGGLHDPKCPAASALALSVRQRQNCIRQIRDGLTARRAVCERPQFAHLRRLSDVSHRREAVGGISARVSQLDLLRLVLIARCDLRGRRAAPFNFSASLGPSVSPQSSLPVVRPTYSTKPAFLSPSTTVSKSAGFL
jgi:hypothetical protein